MAETRYKGIYYHHTQGLSFNQREHNMREDEFAPHLAAINERVKRTGSNYVGIVEAFSAEKVITTNNALHEGERAEHPEAVEVINKYNASHK